MRWIVGRVLRLLKLLIRKFYILLGKVDAKLGVSNNRKAHEFFVRRTAGKYDMHEEADESYYARQYGCFIHHSLSKSGLGQGGVLIDLACGQGRIIREILSYPEIKFDKIIGVDFCSKALSAAHLHLELEVAKKNVVEFICADINEYLDQVEDKSVDVILLLEVLYMVPGNEDVLVKLRRKLNSNGRVFISLRSGYFYGLTTIRLGLFEEAVRTIKEYRGNIVGTDIELNWTTGAKIMQEFTKKYGLDVDDMKGIGPCSGIENDPNDNICRPSDLNVEELKQLAHIEDYYGRMYPDIGRYILFSADPSV